MGFFEIIIIGIGLSMDAVCVSISNGMCVKNLRLKHALINSLAFGFFQGLMPLIGFYAGSLFIGFLAQYSYLLVFVIFMILGLKMIYDALHDDECEYHKVMSFKMLLIQAIATSIDALAVGVGFSVMNTPILSASLLIAVTTLVLSLIAVYIGKKVGGILNKKAEILGGALLLLIGFKVFLENTLF